MEMRYGQNGDCKRAIRHRLSDTLERGQRLSQSLLWKLQLQFFDRQGVEAWNQGTVPHYVTSNPFIANAYGKVVRGFLGDWFSPSGDSLPLNSNQSVYILELGAGSGRFAYHFLRNFFEVFNHSPLSAIPVKYVLTDFTRRNLDFWRTHASLQPYFEQGVLDIARFDMERDRHLTLEYSGEHLTAKTLTNPLIVLATYVFDSIPQDAFSIRQGELYETLVTLSTYQTNPDLEDPDLLNHLDITYDEHPIDSNYYDDPDFDPILEHYHHHLIDTTILFPNVGLRCIRTLRHLAGDRLLLISGDKGYSHEAALHNRSYPQINRHGSFSMMVNHHAIGQYFRDSGGQFLNIPHHHNSLNICAFLLGRPANGYQETQLAYKTAIEQLGPDDFFTLKKVIEQHYDTLAVEQILSYLRLSSWDAKIFFGCFPTLRREIDSAAESLQQDLSQTIDNIWDTYYPIGEQQDLAFHLATLLYKIKDYPKALVYLQHSLKLYGENPNTRHKMALCYYRLGQMDRTFKQLKRALAIDPSFKAARKMRSRIRRSLAIKTGTTKAPVN